MSGERCSCRLVGSSAMPPKRISIPGRLTYVLKSIHALPQCIVARMPCHKAPALGTTQTERCVEQKEDIAGEVTCKNTELLR